MNWRHRVLPLLLGGFLSSIGFAAITAQQKTLLDDHMGSVAKKVGLGTLLDTADTVTATDLPDDVLVEATGTLSQADLVAMNGAAVTLVAAPGAGKVIVVDEMEFFHDYATAAYTGGGDVTVEYATSGTDILVFDVALVTAAADDNWVSKPTVYVSDGTTATSLTSSANKAVTITNATAVFAAGDAANIIKWRIRYHVVTLLS